MKVLLVYATFVVLIVQAYNLALREEDTVLVENKQEFQNNTANTTNSQLELCIDTFGNQIIGTVAYKEDCRKFVQCSFGMTTVVQCQSGLLFNKIRKLCDWPRDANCIEFRAKDKSKLVVPVSDILW